MRTVSIIPGLRLIEESSYAPASMDNERQYENEYQTVPGHAHHTTAYGFERTVGNTKFYPLIVLGFGGASLLGKTSFVARGNKLHLAIDDFVLALDLETLRILWATKVDFATCFGIYWVESLSCLISWGEMEVSKLDLSGKILLSVSGSDIFSGGFRIENDFAFATDFEGGEYKIDLRSGKAMKPESKEEE